MELTTYVGEAVNSVEVISLRSQRVREIKLKRDSGEKYSKGVKL
jgi:hypothetical protein